MEEELRTETDGQVDENPAQSTETDGEAELWQWLTQLDEEATRERSEQASDDQWDNEQAIYWGKQWDANLPSFKLPIVVNELKTYILTEVSDLTDNPLKVFVSKSRTKGEQDDMTEKAIQAEYVRLNVDLAVMEAALDSSIFRCGFLYCGVKKLPSGESSLDIRALDPRCVFPDPRSTNDDDWRYVLIKEVCDLVQLRDEFPERGVRVKPEDAFSQRREGSSPWWQAWKRSWSASYRGPLDGPSVGGKEQGYITAAAEKKTLFIYDDATEDDIQPKKDEQGNPLIDEQGQPQMIVLKKKKYPNGRMIVAANKVILYDGPYPFTGPFPVIRVIPEPTVHAFWPQESPVSGVKMLAQAGNKMDSMVVENGIRLNNGMIVADTSSGINPGTMANIPGQVLLKRDGTNVDVKYPPAMPADMVGAGQRFRDFMAKVLGFAPSRMGTGNRGNVSAELTETEISQAQGLTRLRARLLHMSVQKLIEQMFHRMAQYYTMPRMIPYVSASSWKPVQWQPIVKPEDYGIHVDPASFILRSKTMLQRLTLALAKMGKVSTRYLLTTLEMPDAENEAQRAEQELMMRAMAKKNDKKK